MEKKQILRNVSFEIKQGDIVAIYGSNGSGKSTLIKILLGLNHEYTGEVNLASNLEISYIPQDTSDLTGSLMSIFISKMLMKHCVKQFLEN